MSVKFKIEEARFFLQKIEQDYTKVPDNEYYLSAFLSATYSIRDHLLEDYNKKFHFEIPNDLEFMRIFEKKAREETAKGNMIPSEFLLWYKEKIRTVNEDLLGNILKENRHKTIHSEAITVENLLEDAADLASNEEELERWKIANPWLSIPIFNAIGTISLHMDQCRNILIIMEDFVKETLERFPNELIDIKF
jgi:hypothetical protein